MLLLIITIAERHGVEILLVLKKWLTCWQDNWQSGC